MKHLLAVNAGSSSLKLAGFAVASGAPVMHWQAEARNLNGMQAQWHWQGSLGEGECRWQPGVDAHVGALAQLQAAIALPALDAVVHRIVHGGAVHNGPEPLTPAVLADLQTLVPLAPLHQPVGLHLAALCRQAWPQAAAFACYDTDFHRSLPELETRVPLPEPWPSRGVRHYGFHGISYRYVLQQLLQQQPALAGARIVLAHLGAGASLCAVREGVSCATTMGFSALEGVPMATRAGRLDAGIVLYLLQQGLTEPQLTELLYRDSGLKALSGGIADMQTLLATDSEVARFTVDYFCDRVAREIAGMAAAIGGVDAIVFTGGIGEHAAPVRERIAARCAWLGLQLDTAANNAQAVCLSAATSPVACYRIATHEALSMAQQAAPLL